MRHKLSWLAVVLATLLVPGVVAGSNPEDPISATLDGTSTSVEEAAALGNHCIIGGSDLSCFTNREDRDAAIEGMARGGAGSLLASGVYTMAYADANFGGGSLAIAGNVSNLHSIGFGDRITSFESATNKKPIWYLDTGFGGVWWSWARGSNVGNVGSVANDRFSSVEADS